MWPGPAPACSASLIIALFMLMIIAAGTRRLIRLASKILPSRVINAALTPADSAQAERALAVHAVSTALNPSILRSAQLSDLRAPPAALATASLRHPCGLVGVW